MLNTPIVAANWQLISIGIGFRVGKYKIVLLKLNRPKIIVCVL